MERCRARSESIEIEDRGAVFVKSAAVHTCCCDVVTMEVGRMFGSISMLFRTRSKV